MRFSSLDPTNGSVRAELQTGQLGHFVKFGQNLVPEDPRPCLGVKTSTGVSICHLQLRLTRETSCILSDREGRGEGGMSLWI